MVLRKLLRCGLWLLMVGTSLTTSTQSLRANEPDNVGNQSEGVVRLSDQVPPGAIRQMSHAEAMACGQTAASGCANGSCGVGGCANGACGAAGCGPRGTIVRPNVAGAGNAAGGAYDPNDPCRGRRMYGHGDRWNREVETYSYRDLGQDTFGWAMPNKNCRGNGTGSAKGGNGVCPYCHNRGPCSHCQGWLDQQAEMFFARNRQQSDILGAHIRGKLAWLTPMGNGGAGAPPFGCYQLVYPVAPDYADPHDVQQLYGAQGYGVPVSVPLAPTVRHTMNYSTGMPASRVTPISNVIPPQRYR